MKVILYLSLLILPASVAHAALPGDAAEGKRLHDANCTECHGTGVYTRKDRAIHSLGELKHQLAGCEHAAKKNFSAAQSQDIIKYLNDQFYHFQ
jgi:mono/diheme cytochrome c family protein